MFEFFSKSHKPVGKRSPESRQMADDHTLVSDLEENVDLIRRLFEDVDILRIKYIDSNCDKRLQYCIIYCDGVVDSKIISENLIKPLTLSPITRKGGDFVQAVMNQIVQLNETSITDSVEKIVEAVSYGDTVLFISGEDRAIILNTKEFHIRSVSEPDNERVMNGPREGFTEALMINLSLIRRKVLSADLKMKFRVMGRRTHTKICVLYMEGLVNKQVLDELYRRLDTVDMDGILDSNYLTEMTKDAPWSPFRTTGYTEKPDVVVGKLLEGRVAVIVDGSPVVMTVPYLFIENFQSGEDYYLNYFYATFSRIIRILGFFMAISVPAIYIAVGDFHQEMFPLQLFISIAAERQSVPLPAAVEAFVMVILFDILRETGARMPSNVGQAMSIVGALVIGQAAVQAKLVAAPMIIVVALTGISSLLVPKLNAPVIYIRLILLAAASTFGLFGVVLGFSALLVHLINLKSFGVPHISTGKKLSYQNVKDSFMRGPWWTMITRPGFAENRVRMKKSEKKHE